ncbi:hypothetical protein FAI41_04575 [Acetobacteraceae bacterium]|nr:hypothetical protein FAI41_04575 [Acetobacteraceae bacterium]
MISLKTDPQTNDFYLDAAGNIAVASENEAIVQDVGSALSTWIGEIPFNPLLGIDYAHFFLENQNDIETFILQLERAAQNVSGVKSAKITLDPLGDSRILNGKIQITKNNEEIIYASF